jgi:hypothetical protein
METTEKIIESSCRYVKQWFSILNAKCGSHVLKHIPSEE